MKIKIQHVCKLFWALSALSGNNILYRAYLRCHFPPQQHICCIQYHYHIYWQKVLSNKLKFIFTKIRSFKNKIFGSTIANTGCSRFWWYTEHVIKTALYFGCFGFQGDLFFTIIFSILFFTTHNPCIFIDIELLRMFIIMCLKNIKVIKKTHGFG